MQDKAKPKEAPKPAPPPPEPIPGFNLATLKQAVELKNGSPLLACRFSPNGRWLYTSAQDNTIQQWDLTADKDGKIAGKKSRHGRSCLVDPGHWFQRGQQMADHRRV